MRYILFIGVCLLAAGGVAPGQYHFAQWTTDNGLPQNSVLSIVQTRDGYLWLATSDGLVRYDGVRFTVFNRSNYPNLPGTRFTYLYEAPDGALWAGTDEAGIVRYQNGQFTAYNTRDGLPDNRVWRIYGDSKNSLIVLTANGLAIWREGRWARYPHQSALQTSATVSATDTLWVVDNEAARKIVNDVVVATYPWPRAPQPVGPIFVAHEDRQGRLWIGTESGLYCLHNGNFTGYPQLPRLGVIAQIYEDTRGDIWICANYGLFRFHEGRFARLTTADGLPSEWITAICEDREGALWFGTGNSGLVRMTRRFITTYSTAEGLLNQNVYPLYQAPNGDIWAGVLGGPQKFVAGKFVNHPMMQRLVPPDRYVLTYPAPPTQADLEISALYQDSQGVLWIGAWGWLLSLEGKRLTPHLNIRPNTWPVWDIHQDPAGVIWAATENGLLKLQGREITRYDTTHGLPGNDVRLINETRDGAFWLGTYSGLARWQDGQVTALLTEKDGLAGNRIRALYEEPDGTLWIGTYDQGLSRYKDGKFTTYNTQNGLFNNGVFVILEDQRGNFWMNSNRGIYRVSKQQLNDFADSKIPAINSIGYDKQDGMLNSEGNGGRQPAGFVARDGKLWFPTQDGVAVVDPEAVPDNPLPPPVLLEEIKLDQKSVPLAGEIQIAPNQNNLEITYTALSFNKPAQIHFKYQLEGQDPAWIDAGTRRMAYYSYLPPGAYTFRVMAANSDGIWNKTGAAVKIIVLPPFYRTWWFILAVLAGTGATVWGLYRQRIRRLRQTHALREAFSQQLLATQAAFSQQLITSQESERQRIAAELHDGLGQNLLIIKNLALLGGLAANGDSAAKERFDGITASAAESVEEVRHIAYNLRPYHLDRLGLTTSLAIMVSNVAEASGLDITAELVNVDKIFPPEQEINLYRVVQECLNNIVKHSGATAATVALRHDESSLTIVVRDNGVGFALSDTAPDAALRGGFGLIGLAERVRMLQGTHAIESTPGQGVAVSIHIAFPGT